MAVFKAWGDIQGTSETFSYKRVDAVSEEQCRAIVHTRLNKKYGRKVFLTKRGYGHSPVFVPFEVEKIQDPKPAERNIVQKRRPQRVEQLSLGLKIQKPSQKLPAAWL